MLTEIGKFLRKERIERGSLLKDMAKGIGVSPAYLSTIETGKRPLTDEIFAKLANYMGYARDSNEFCELEHAAQMSRQQVEIEMKGRSEKHKEAALAFARQFNEMGDGDIDKALQLLKQVKGK